MTSGVKQARRLVEHSGDHHVVSLYLDLDPEQFATPPARASQIRSLIDEGRRTVDGDHELDHQDKAALREDLQRIESFLESSDAPFRGARALAVFCSSADGLFETVQLSQPAPARLIISRSPYVEPLLAGAQQRRWLVALVSRADARLLTGSPGALRERERLEDDVHGQHTQGGWSQARYERSVERDVDEHLRRFAEAVQEKWQAERFERIALGGPQETVPRFQELLSEEIQAHLAAERVDVDLSSAGEADIREAVERIVEEDDRRSEREDLDRFTQGVAGAGRAVGGIADTLSALNERRVEHLLIDPGFEGQGQRCPSCGQLLPESEGACPADGTPVEPVEDLREAAVEAALLQDARVTVTRHHDDLAQSGIGALLRF